MTENELIAELREHADEVHAHSTRGAEVMREAADALEARQPSENDREAAEAEADRRFPWTGRWVPNLTVQDRRIGFREGAEWAFSRAAVPDAEVAAKALEDAADEIDNADDYEPFKNRTESAPLGWTDWAIEASIQSSGVITDRLRARAAECRKAVQTDA